MVCLKVMSDESAKCNHANLILPPYIATFVSQTQKSSHSMKMVNGPAPKDLITSPRESTPAEYSAA